MTTQAISAVGLSGNIQPSQLWYQAASQESEYLFIKNFCQDSLPASERPQERIIQQIGNSKTVKTQIVSLKALDSKEEKIPCGVIVYEENAIQPKSITVHLLRTTDDHLFSGKGLSRHMLYKVTRIAERLQCSSVYASINSLDQTTVKFFEKNGFQMAPEGKTNPDSQNILLIKQVVIEEPIERKRPQPSPAPSQEMPPKVARVQKFPTPPSAKPMEATLKNPYLSFIKSGRKTIEGRIAAGMFARVAAGTKIKFFNHQDQVSCLITKVTKYSSFGEMLEKEGVEKCLPGTKTLEAGIRIYDSIPSYTARAQKSGVLALQLQVERI